MHQASGVRCGVMLFHAFEFIQKVSHQIKCVLFLGAEKGMKNSDGRRGGLGNGWMKLGLIDFSSFASWKYQFMWWFQIFRRVGQSFL